jgi:hypothetical protein
VLGDRGELLGQGVDDPVELGVHGLGVGLVVDRVQQRLDPRPAALRGRGHQVRGVVRAAALPGGAGDRRPDRVDQAGVRVEVTSLTPVRPRAVEVAEERQPAGAVLAGGDLDAEDLAVPVGVDAGRDQHVHRHHPAALADLEHVSASAATNVNGPASVEPAGAELLDVLVELLGHLETCDLLRPVMPRVCTSLSIRRVDTPSR